MTNEITLVELQKALIRCLTAHPTDTAEFALHPDASTLCGPFAEMRHFRLEAIPIDEVKPAVREAFNRWRDQVSSDALQ
jgi:hypothetical protein